MGSARAQSDLDGSMKPDDLHLAIDRLTAARIQLELLVGRDRSLATVRMIRPTRSKTSCTSLVRR